MKRNTIYAFLITLALVFTGCGSNSLEDPSGGGDTPGGTTPTGQITTTLQDMTIDKNTGSIVTSVTLTSTYASTVEATLSDMDIVLGGCTLDAGSLSVNPNTVTLNSDAPTQNVTLSGILSDTECVPSSYQVTGTNEVLENGIIVTEDFVTSVVAIDEADVNIITIGDSTQITLSVVTKQLDINESGLNENITVRVLKGQVGEEGQNVVITNMSSVVGSFDATTVTSDAAGDTVFTYTSPDPILDSNFTVEFCLETNTSMCDTATINLTTSAIVEPEEPIDNINYFITFVPNNGVNNLDLGARNNAIVTLIDKDTKEAIPSENVKSITITSRDTSILKLTPEGGGVPIASVSFNEGRNAVPVLLTADKYNSGLAVIEVIIEYTNLNGAEKTRGQLFTVAVLSGEATAFSITPKGVSYNFDTKQFEQNYLVQANDASGNAVATTGYINVSAMAGFAKDTTGREILYGRFSDGISATLSSNDGRGMLELNGGLSPFDTINKNRAFVAVFSQLDTVDTYEANGKWNIDEIVSGNTLSFSNEYNGETYSNLGMAVGYPYRDKICTSAYEESVVVVDSADGTYLLDEKGQAVVTLKYDSYMIGKRVMVLVNMTGLNPSTGEVKRSGEVHEDTLSFSLPLKGDTFPIPNNAVDWGITLQGNIDTGTDDEYPVINSTFSCTVKGDEGITGISKVIKNIPASCAGGGVAYVYYEVNASADGGTVTLDKCQVDSEPLF